MPRIIYPLVESSEDDSPVLDLGMDRGDEPPVEEAVNPQANVKQMLQGLTTLLQAAKRVQTSVKAMQRTPEGMLPDAVAELEQEVDLMDAATGKFLDPYRALVTHYGL